MKRKELVEKINGNTPAAWLLFEHDNLSRTFMDSDATRVMTQTRLTHTMADTLENLMDVFMQLIWGTVPEDELWDEAYDQIMSLRILSIGHGHVTWE